MKDFQKIDWKLYNRPPFYQQWLCKEDTLKLASFGDGGLSEVDDQALALKNQWDLENVKGHSLDRIGKLLGERRNGDTDERYRILLKLRTILNANDGSIPSIIKAIKFFYSSEVVHITPDYPAGLIIEHDGEGTPGLNFNRLLAEIIPAGVSFSTKELFHFIDAAAARDELEAAASRMAAEGVEIRDAISGRVPQNYEDRARARAVYDGAFAYNGERSHSGFLEAPFYDALKAEIGKSAADNETAAESLAVHMSEPLDESLAGPEDALAIGGGGAGADAADMAEGFSAGRRFHREYGGAYKYDGGILHNGNVFTPI